jgi:methyltransferase (TIGR00027 family)
MRENRASTTASLIAAATVFLSRDTRLSGLVPAGAAGLCARCLKSTSPLRYRAVLALSHPILRWAVWLAERATVPGLMLHFMLRKRWIEEVVRSALADGCAQVVVVGAGFDTLAPRLSTEFPGASFSEIDHPATQAGKRLAIDRCGHPGNLGLIAADLARSRLQDVLSSGGRYRSDARSAFVVEGLLMYLNEAEVAGIFTALREMQRAGGRIIFTVMEPTSDGRPAFHNATPLVRRLLASWSEPFKSALRRDQVAAFLDRFGFRLLDLAHSESLRERYLRPAGLGSCALAQGEMIVVAECEEQPSPEAS